MNDLTINLGKSKEGNVILDFGKTANRHIAIVGGTGRGKSVAGQKCVKDITANGQTSVVFDFHNLFSTENIFPEYRDEIVKMTHEVNVYANGISLPIFTPLPRVNGSTEDMLDVTTAIADVFCNTLSLGARQRECLIDAVTYVGEENMYATHGIQAVGRALEMADDERAAAIYTRLRYAFKRNLFVDGPLFIEPGKINVLRLSSLSDSVQILTIEIVLNYFWRLANAGAFMEKGLCLFLDECQNLKWGKGGIMQLIMTEGRRLGLQLVMVTQSVRNARSVMANGMLQAATQMYFAPPSQEVVTIAKLIAAKNTMFWQMKLKSLCVGECVATGVFQINGSQYAGAVKLQI